MKANINPLFQSNKIRKTFAIIYISAALSGCAYNIPPIISLPPPQETTATDVGQILAQAFTLQKTYQESYKSSANADQLGQLPLIGLASVAALILFNGKPNAASQAGKLGIAGGAYSATRGVLSGPGLADFYLKGHGALTCVIQEGTMFSGDGAKQQHARLVAALDLVNGSNVDSKGPAQLGAIRELEAAIARGVDKPLDQALIDNWKKLAAETLAAARLVAGTSLAEDAAFTSGGGIFRGAVSSISVRVATKARVRPEQATFASVLASLQPPAPKADKAQGGGSTAQPDWVNEVSLTNSNLLAATAALRASTPGYLASLSRVARCPETI